MNIDVRFLTKYAEVTVSDSNTTMVLGPLDEREQFELAQELREAADRLDPSGGMV